MKARTVASLLQRDGGKLTDLNPALPKRKFWTPGKAEIFWSAVTIVSILALGFLVF